MTTQKGYVPLRRGLVEHLPKMPSTALKAYVALLCLADHKTGTVEISTRQLAETIGVSVSTAHGAVKLLESEPAYISCSQAVARNASSTITILRFQPVDNSA